ncbi:hypothetical protein [Bacterioplanoides pacificum]|uniref:Ig-like domain-containing protein n=1 Tax=Bacterioplanoides pacificum TaxID=1171596 RepID=A0ABV7VWC3_9GAMM
MALQKAKLALAIATVSSSLAMTGCLVDGDKANSTSTTISNAETGNNSDRVSTPVGTVMGTVIDTNGNPVAGARVYVGGRSVTTGQGGSYEINNVPVSNLVVTDDNNYVGGDIRLSIVPPEGFLGAIVTVEPTAVIDDGRSDQGTSEETGSGSTNRFIDGFTAVAGDAVLPAIGANGATVTGVLRDTVTKEPIGNQTINLELQDVNGGDHTALSGAISYTTVSYPAVTAADGSFTIEGVANDADLNFIIAGHSVTGVQDNSSGSQGVTTNDEVETIHVGNVYATAIPNIDDARPFVTAIEEVAMNGGRGKLHDDTTNVLTVHFSEQLALTDSNGDPMVDTNSVIVRDLDSNAYLTVTAAMAADGRSLTLTADTDFVAGHEIDIYLLKVDFRDTSANMLDEDSNVTTDNILYDEDDVNGKDDYVNLKVEVYRELNTNAAVVTNLTQATVDDSPLRMPNLLDNASSAFADVDMEVYNGGSTPALGVQQLNSADDDNGNSASDVAGRLASLVGALDQAGIVDGSSVIQLNDDGTPILTDLDFTANFAVDVARLSFTPSNAATYRYWIQSNGTAVSTNISIDPQSSPDAKTTNTASDFTTVANNQGYGTIEPEAGSSYADFAGTDIAFLVSGVQPGDVIYIQSMDDFGNTGSVTSITLVDNVPVTTGLQDSYQEQDLTSSTTVFGEEYGNGGELANPDAQALIGSPLLNINSGMLADQDIVTDNTPSLDNLYEGNRVDTAGSGDPFIDPALEIYDATAYAAWSTDMSRTIAVSFTEDLAWVAPQAGDQRKPDTNSVPDTSVAITTGLTDWTIMNDVTVTSDDQSINADLVAFSVNNIFTLANTDGQNAGVIDFSDRIQDQAGNVATAAANAKVVINDAMPPMVSKAVYSGKELTLTFNEPVKVSEDTSIAVVTLGGVDIFLNEDTIALHNAQPAASRTELVIPFTTNGADDMLPVDRVTAFGLGKYDEPATNVNLSSAAADAEGHAALSFVNVQDDFGNTWADDDTNLTAPTFAAFDNLGDMQVTAPNALATGVTTQNLTYTFTHAVDIDALLGAQSAGVVNLDGADVATLLTYTGGTSINTNSTGTVSADRRTISFTLNTVAATASGDTVDFNANVESLWDLVDDVNVPVITAP